MKKLLILFVLMVLVSCSKEIKMVKIIDITPNCKLGFSRYDKNTDLYYQPYLIKNGETLPIKNYPIDNGCNSGYIDLKVSPNKKHFIIENIIKGYSNDGEGEKLHENYLCSIVNIEGDSIALGSLQDRCDGEWNNKNQFVFENKIVFDGK